MRGELKEYVMPDGNTYQFWDCDVPPEAKPAKAKPEVAEKPKRKAVKQ